MYHLSVFLFWKVGSLENMTLPWIFFFLRLLISALVRRRRNCPLFLFTYEIWSLSLFPSDTQGLKDLCLYSCVYLQAFVEKLLPKAFRKSVWTCRWREASSQFTSPVEEFWLTREAIFHAFTVSFINMLVCRWNGFVIPRNAFNPEKQYLQANEWPFTVRVGTSWAIPPYLFLQSCRNNFRYPSVLKTICMQFLIQCLVHWIQSLKKVD